MPTGESTLIRDAAAGDATTVAEIYNHYIRETVVTFEEQEVPVTEMIQRIETIQQQSFPWLVAEQAGGIVGYAYAGRWHHRAAYRHSVESTVYLLPAASGQGIGSLLYDALLQRLVKLKIHTVIGGIALPNEASVALHEKFGFQKVAHYQQVGHKFNRWIDVGYWQRLLKD